MKKFIIIALIIVLIAGSFSLFYFLRHREKTHFSKKDFPNALNVMDEYTLDITIEGLNKEYEDLKQAETDYEKYLRWIEIGIIKKRLTDYQGAEQAWLKANSIDPEHPMAIGNLADLYLYHTQQYEKAEEYYKKAIELNPYHCDYYYGIADLYRYNLTDKADLIEGILLEGAMKNPVEAANLTMYLAIYFAKEGNDLEKAKEYVEKTLILNPALESQLPEL